MIRPITRATARLLLMFGIALLSWQAQASLNGKPVVLIHGFQYQQLGTQPTDASLQAEAIDYWQEYWLQRSEVVLYWSASERISQGISDQIKRQVKTLADNGTCQAGCVLLTHSTGDLVARQMLRNLNGWLWEWGYPSSRVNFLVSLDMAGAGGGTELADLAVSVIDSDNIFSSAATSVVNWFLGTNVSPNELGVVRDLQPAAARSLATQNNAVPRLRFVGSGDTFLRASKPFILGHDDSVVPLHSACGSVRQENLESCSASIKTNGELDAVSKAPTGLRYNNFPILMGDSTDHFEVIGAASSGDYAPVINNINVGGLGVDFAIDQYWSWWHWDTVRLVRDGSDKSLSANVFDTLNQ